MARTGVAGARVDAPGEARRGAVARHRVVDARRDGHEREQARAAPKTTTSPRQGPPAARAEERDPRLGGEGLGRVPPLERHEVEEDRAHRDVQERHGADAERERPRQRAAADRAPRPPACWPPTSRRTRRSAMTSAPASAGTSGGASGRRSTKGAKCDEVARAGGEAPRDEARRAGRSWRAPARARWRPRQAHADDVGQRRSRAIAARATALGSRPGQRGLRVGAEPQSPAQP